MYIYLRCKDGIDRRIDILPGKDRKLVYIIPTGTYVCTYSVGLTLDMGRSCAGIQKLKLP